MRRRSLALLLVGLAGLFVGGIIMSGCGEKIAIPEAQGVFSIDQYKNTGTHEMADQVIQLTQGWSSLFVLTSGTLTKMDIEFGNPEEREGLANPRSICIDEELGLVFVWEEDAKRASWYSVSNLEALGSTDMPGVGTAVAMATNASGIEQVPDAETFLYLSDPVSGAIHRYSFNQTTGLAPFGILSQSNGFSVRDVHIPVGMFTDSEGYLLVCDVDTNRNWVTRFDSTPDPTDTAADPADPDPRRGFAVLFSDPTCAPEPATADYVLGNAAECDESDWVGGPSDELGEFHGQADVAVDYVGRIYVADTLNQRIQVFGSTGGFDIQFKSSDSESVSGPKSLGVFDVEYKNNFYYGGYIFVGMQDSPTVVKYVSFDLYQAINGELPDPDPK